MHASLHSARTPGPQSALAPLICTPPRPGPLPPPPRPASALTFSARAVKGGLPGITSARRHLLRNSQLSRGRAHNNQVRGQKGGRRKGGKRQARCPPKDLPSQRNSMPPTPSRPQSPAQNGDEEKGAGASTTIHLLRERALASLVYWSPPAEASPGLL